jgi:hypothetical protein
MSNQYTPQHISPEQLARVISIIEEQKEKETMENTWNKFQKETQEPTLCGACGQYYEDNQQGDDGYHSPEICDANDEVCEDCDNGTDLPCVACIKEDINKAYGIKE